MSEEESSGAGEEPRQSEGSSPQLPANDGGESAAAAKFFELMTKAESERGSARASLQSVQQLLEKAADFAHEWMLNDERSLALEELGKLHLERREYMQAVRIFTRLSNHQVKVYGSEHPVLARTYTLIGKAYHQKRDPHFAIKNLREAIVRYQCSDSLDLTEFVESLCTLSQVYREQGQHDLAKTAVKQALTVVSAQERGGELSQARLLDEFGSLLYDTRDYEAAIQALSKAIGIKQTVLGQFDYACVKSLISLGLTFYSARDFDSAEKAFVQAALTCQMTRCDDNAVKAEIFYKLAGTYRVMGRMAEAGIMEDAGKEVGGGQMELHLYNTFRKDLEAGYAAEKAGMLDNALRSYRQSLSVIESFRHRNTSDRIAVLIRMLLLAESRGQKVQAATIEVEIDQELTELFAARRMEPVQVAIQLSRLFRIQGKNIAADAFLIYAEREYRRRHDLKALSDVFQQRATILLEANQKKESSRLDKLARRLKRQFPYDGDASTLSVSKGD